MTPSCSTPRRRRPSRGRVITPQSRSLDQALKTIPELHLRLLHDIATRVLRFESQLSTAEVVDRLDQVRDSIVVQANDDAHLIGELQRIVLRHRLQLLASRDLDHAVVQATFHDAVNLGFSNLLDEGTLKICFSRYCIRQSRPEEARVWLNGLLAKAGDTTAGPYRVRFEIKRDAKKLLASLA